MPKRKWQVWQAAAFPAKSNKKRSKKTKNVGCAAENFKAQLVTSDQLDGLEVTWTDHQAKAVISLNQVAVFLGFAELVVLQGDVEVAGKVVTATSGPVRLTADQKVSGPLRIVPQVHHVQVPRAQSAAAVVQFVPVVQRSGQQSCVWPQNEVGEGSGLGFDVWVQDADAPLPGWLTQPAEWQQAVSSIVDSSSSGVPSVLLCGPKAAGKSTLMRRLVNSLLNVHSQVALLDTDCGQPELTPPGCVSLSLLDGPLFGPPHMQPLTQPARCHFIGDTSPRSDPIRYLAAVKSLYRWYSTVNCSAPLPPPLIINTHGWVKGLGLDLLSEMLCSIRVTHVLQLNTNSAHKDVPNGLFWLPQPVPVDTPLPSMCYVPALTTQSQATTSAAEDSAATGDAGGGQPSTAGTAAVARGLSPFETRSLQWMSFARHCCAAALHPTRGPIDGSSLADELAALPPYRVDWKDVEVEVLFGEVLPAQRLYALNGGVVGLVTGTPEHRHDQHVATPRDGFQPRSKTANQTAGPALSTTGSAPAACVGYGIVRSIDVTNKCFYILTNVPPERLKHVTCFQLGRLELPLSLLSSRSISSPYLSMHGMQSVATGSRDIRSRNNIARLRLA